jgi:hypothetical protein
MTFEEIFILLCVVAFIIAFFYYAVLINYPSSGPKNKTTTGIQQVFR